jgi:hypothetical protein
VTFKLLCIAMILGIVAAAMWLIVELQADKRDRTRYEVTTPRDRMPPQDDV